MSYLCGVKDDASQKLESLRKYMANYELAVYIIPFEDQHQSEYVSPNEQRGNFITGFAANAGVAIVSRDITNSSEHPEGTAALFTDSSCLSRPIDELSSKWIFLKTGLKYEHSWMEWAAKQAIKQARDSSSVARIGLDPKLIPFNTVQIFNSVIMGQVEELSDISEDEINLVPITENLVDKVWLQFEEKRSTETTSPVRFLELSFLGQKTSEKLDKVKGVVEEKGCDGLMVSALDEIAWLLNLRGCDIDYSPVFYSYFIVTPEDFILYTNGDRFNPGVTKELWRNQVGVKPYEEFWSDLNSISESFQQNNKKMLLPKKVSWEVVRNVKSTFEQSSNSPIGELKAVKNTTELEGAIRAHRKDGVAICCFLSWLENELVVKNNLIDEMTADEKLTDFRRQQDGFTGLSFPSISATDSNAAIVHYQPLKQSSALLDVSKLYLNDSGSQFVDGTTDMTRTVHFGTPYSEEIKHYTLVLKGLIALSSFKFPENTPGIVLDAVARQFLWACSLDYPHATSHGVGSYLSVIEGPVGLAQESEYSLVPGNLLSNEPGFYVDGSHGVRIENVMYVKNSNRSPYGKPYFVFETITRVPFCRRLIDITLLSCEERTWINNYHSAVWHDIYPSLAKPTEISWLKRETSPL